MIEPTDVQVEGLDDEERQKLSAAFREALSAGGGKWEQAAADDEWTPRRIA